MDPAWNPSSRWIRPASCYDTSSVIRRLHLPTLKSASLRFCVRGIRVYITRDLKQQQTFHPGLLVPSILATLIIHIGACIKITTRRIAATQCLHVQFKLSAPRCFNLATCFPFLHRQHLPSQSNHLANARRVPDKQAQRAMRDIGPVSHPDCCKCLNGLLVEGKACQMLLISLVTAPG